MSTSHPPLVTARKAAAGLVTLAVLALSLGTRLPARAGATTYTVTNTSDSGPGSLREGILEVNAPGGPTQIRFNIPNSSPTIVPLAALPAVANPLVIDGTTQPGYAGSPMIEITGTSLPANTNGLQINASGCTVRGLVINGCTMAGLWLRGGHNTVEGCYVGTDRTGATARPNDTTADWCSGLYVESSGNVIGGTSAGTQNVISGNVGHGLAIAGVSTTGNLVLGNRVGTNPAGSAAVPNSREGVLFWQATGNTLGSTLAAGRNLVSGNGGSGVSLASGANNNVVIGNLIGTDLTGQNAVPNTHGVNIDGASSNLVGGASSGSRNIVSGNRQNGIFVSDGAAGNVIQGNYAGTDVTGTVAIPNAQSGIYLYDAINTQIGGTASGAANLISGNKHTGLYISHNLSSGNRVEGNLIGTDVTGTKPIGNGDWGLVINTAQSNTVGGPTAAQRNTISGNQEGLAFVTTVTDFGGANILQGNYVGLDVTGSRALPNRGLGVWIGCPNNSVDGNVLSGNVYGGLRLGPSVLPASGNTVHSNRVGTDTSGTTAVPNCTGGGEAVSIEGSNNLIDSNLVSGNATDGIQIVGSDSTGNLIQANTVGLAIDGETAMGNAGDGIQLVGSYPTGNTLNANVISGNSLGIRLTGTGATSSSAPNLVTGNLIGTDSIGASVRPNATNGILIDNVPNCIVGGTDPSMRNILSGNKSYGVELRNTGTTGTQILGNYIGLDRTGTFAVPNQGHGLVIGSGASGNVVGGTAAGAGNVISGNGQAGVRLAQAATNNRVQGNFIGTGPAGTGALGNGFEGVWVYGYGNSPTGNQIGGTAPEAGNVIAGNRSSGVTVGSDGRNNPILSNRIYGNAGLGIDLSNVSAGDGVTPNHVGGLTAGGNGLENYPVVSSTYASGTGTIVSGSMSGAPNTAYRIELFSNAAADASGFGQGEQFMGSVSVTTDGTGFSSFKTTISGSYTGRYFTATATDPIGNTSEFSAAVRDTWTDVSPPACGSAVVGTNGSGQVTAAVTVQDTDSGLASIRVVNSSNCTVSWPSFVPGTTSPVTVTATKLNQSQRSSFTFQVADLAGNVANCDPVVTTLSIGKGQRSITRTFRRIRGSERFVTIRNGSPGLSRLTVSVNGRSVSPSALAPGTVLALDVSEGLRSGQNALTVTAWGAAGTSAVLLIGDTPGVAPPVSGRSADLEWGE